MNQQQDNIQSQATRNVRRVLVVGANSYIGDWFAKYAKLNIDIVDSYNQWKTTPFEGYDSILYVAGIAHRSQRPRKHETNKEIQDLYFAINRDLAIAVAKKAIASGVGQFIYLSSMSVYGLDEGVITSETIPTPHKNDFYGQSKHEAEAALQTLFHTGTPHHNFTSNTTNTTSISAPNNPSLCILRPPMVYGPNCPGNFSRLVQLTKRLPLFPKIDNKRSMIYIENLCAFIAYVVENNCAGIYLPQNKEHINTTNLVQTIAKILGKKMRTTRLLNPLVLLLSRAVSPVKKMFGSLVYKHCKQVNTIDMIGFEESIALSVNDD